MTMQLSVAARNAWLAAIVTALGGNATAKFYNGTRSLTPAGTLLATITFGATACTDANGGTAGGIASGVLTFGGITQVPGGFVAGTPTFVLLSTSAGTAVLSIDIGSGAGTITFTGAIVNGQSITDGGLTITAGNP